MEILLQETAIFVSFLIIAAIGMSEKLNSTSIKAMIDALNNAASAIADQLFANGVPTAESFQQMCEDALNDAKDTLSSRLGSMLSMESLNTGIPGTGSVKINLQMFYGSIKGRCTVNGMKSRVLYDLDMLLKQEKLSAIIFSSTECMKGVSMTLATIPTKVSSAVASYVAKFGVTKVEVMDEFAQVEETMMCEIVAAVHKAVRKCVHKLDEGSADAVEGSAARNPD